MKIADIMDRYSLNSEERAFFEAYLSNQFANRELISQQDTSFLEKWQGIVAYARLYGGGEALNKYITAKRPVEFKTPNDVALEIYNSFAGEIPIVYIRNTEDFEAFVTNALYKGIRPENLSETGASFAFGKTTRFIILSAKPYSNVPANEVGLSEGEWGEKSMLLRREHECTHYFTKQFFGTSNSNLHDELLADFFGIYEVFGEYRAEYFQRFMGLLDTSGGRFKFYTVNASEKVYKAIVETAKCTSEYLERFSHSEEFLSMSRRDRVIRLCRMGLTEMCEGNQ